MFEVIWIVLHNMNDSIALRTHVTLRQISMHRLHLKIYYKSMNCKNKNKYQQIVARLIVIIKNLSFYLVTFLKLKLLWKFLDEKNNV